MRIKLGLQSLSYLNYVSWFNCLKIYVDNSILNKEYISIDSKLVGGQKSNLHSVAKSLPIRRIWYTVMNPNRKSGPQLYTIQFGSYIVGLFFTEFVWPMIHNNCLNTYHYIAGFIKRSYTKILYFNCLKTYPIVSMQVALL